jgi:hypothetical protein
MSLQLLSQVATFLLVVPPLLGAAAAIWAIRAIRRPPRADRRDRRTAIVLAFILGSLPLVAIPAFFGLLGQAWGGSAGPGIVVGLPIGAGVALAVVLTGVTGYAALARPGRGSSALVGVLLGPLVLGGALGIAVQLKGSADAAAHNFLHADVAVADPGDIVAGRVTGIVRLEVRLRADESFLFDQGWERGRAPYFRLRPPGIADDPQCWLEANASPADPVRLEGGQDHLYLVELPVPADAPASCAFPPGDWWLDLIVRGSRAGGNGGETKIIQTLLQLPG